MKFKISLIGINRLMAIILLILITCNAYSQTGAADNNSTTALNPKSEAKQNVDKNNATDLSDINLIRKRVIDDLLAPTVNIDFINKLVTTIQTDGSWANINYVDTSRIAFQHREHLEQMLELSRAYKKIGSPLYKNNSVKKAALSALDFWLIHNFICQNWWWNEMGTPSVMINTLLILDTDLTEKQRTQGLKIANRANLSNFGSRPGGDLIQIAGMLGKQGLFKRDESVVALVVKTMANQIEITAGRGLQADMSFHHRTDNVISTLTYGTGYASAFSYWAVKIAGTKFSMPDAAIKLIIDYYLDGISKSMAFGKYPDIGAKNRDLSRKGTLLPVSDDIPANLLLSSNYRKAELENIVKIRTDKASTPLQWNKFFWHSAYFTHQRPQWFSSVRMHSSRQNNMEEPHNEEGLKNHHFADGSNFITITGKEYVDIFPVWDWQKIPGATIVQKPALPAFKEIAKKGRTNFVGGVSNGLYGAAATDFVSTLDSLKARKAWFFFANEYVCLGAAINSTAKYPVITTLNQCNLNGDVVVNANNSTTTVQKGMHDLTNVSWIHHDGVAYIFPKTIPLTISNAEATGNWRSITHQDWATEEVIKKEVFTAYVQHGIVPVNEGYAYIVVPAIKAVAVDNYRSNSGITILANTAQLQAVNNLKLQIATAVFYQPGSIKLSNGVTLTCKNPCIVLVEMNGSKIKTLSMSDPTQLLSTLQLEIAAPVKITGKNVTTSYNKENNITTITVTLPAALDAGKSITMTVEN